MVAQPLTPAPAALPALTDHESHLLHTFMLLRFDIIALAEQEKLNPAEVLAFAQSPAVQANLAELKKFSDLAFALRADESRTLAIDTLEQVAKSSDNQVERRRAAGAILRAVNPARPSKSQPSPRGAPQPSTPALNTPEPPSRLPPNLRATPTFSPAPDLSPQRVVELADIALQYPKDPAFISSLDALLTPDATLNDQPITHLPDLAAIRDPASVFIRAEETRRGSDSIQNFQALFFDSSPINFTLIRSPGGPNPNCWLISQIDTS